MLLALILTWHCRYYSSQATTEIMSSSAATRVAEYSAWKNKTKKQKRWCLLSIISVVLQFPPSSWTYLALSFQNISWKEDSIQM